MVSNIAVIGTGISGLACMNHLDPDKFQITAFEKKELYGGRTLSGYMDGHEFDLGAQYINSTDSPFNLVLKKWLDKGWIREWKGRLGELKGSRLINTFDDNPVYVGMPSMNSIAKNMADLPHVSFQINTQVVSILKKFNNWYLFDKEEKGYGPFDRIIFAIPPDNVISLIEDYQYLIDLLQKVRMKPRWGLYVSLDYGLKVDYDGIFVNHDAIRWMARNNSKPGRSDKESWVIHASKGWSKENADKDPEWVENFLIDKFTEITGYEELPINDSKVRLWENAIVDDYLDQNFVIDNDRSLALCGDYCLGDNIEAAYLSGMNLGKRLSQ